MGDCASLPEGHAGWSCKLALVGTRGNQKMILYTPPKTNMTGWKIHHEWRCIYFLLNMVDIPASHVRPTRHARRPDRIPIRSLELVGFFFWPRNNKNQSTFATLSYTIAASWEFHTWTGWWQLKYFLFSLRKLGKWSNLTIIFFRWVGITN